MNDIIERLAACIAGTVTPEARDAIALEACAEIARLRLTDSEREAVEKAAATAQESVDKKLMGWEADAVTAATLRVLLERLGGER